jgi:small subunit ribosomal protein S20
LANTKSALKQWRASLKRRERGRPARRTVRTFVAKAVATVQSHAEDAAEVVRQAVSALDKAAEKRLIHPNNAARRKSRLMKKLNAMATAPEPAAAATPARRARATARTAAAPKAKAAPKPKAAAAPTTRTRRTTTKS